MGEVDKAKHEGQDLLGKAKEKIVQKGGRLHADGDKGLG